MLRLLRRLFGAESGMLPSPVAADDGVEVERPWLRRWDFLPKRSAGPDFTRDDYAVARRRAEEVARATLGDHLWDELRRQGHLDLPSRRHPGVTYRLRV